MKISVELLIAGFVILSLIGCSSSGAITGCVCDPQSGGIQNVNVLLVGHNQSWSGASTGSNGQFLLKNVPKGIYRIKASHVGYHLFEFYNVEVGSDSASVVMFRMANIALQIIPMPIAWERTDSNMIPLYKFIQSGELFNLKCK